MFRKLFINSVFFNAKTKIHTSQSLGLKEIIATEKGKTTIFEGKYIESPREPFFVKSPEHIKESCPVCRLNLDVKHTDVLILQQFVRTDGCMLPRRITGLCAKQQKRIANMVAMAQKAGILYLPGSKVDPSKRKDYKKFNTYYDENTIKTRGWGDMSRRKQ